MQSFSEQQKLAASKAIEAFKRDGDAINWVILLAQMQSGKTETYLLVACKLIRAGLIKRVIVFSGNTETDLRDQLKDQLKVGSKFFEKYVNALSEEASTTMNIKSFQESIMLLYKVREEVTEILYRFTVVWGCELNSYSGPNNDNVFEDIFFIWEEAHYAQSLDQRPAKFLEMIGVSADGNAEYLERNRNIMMTISGTPFSELVDNIRQMQGKYVVKMMPGDGYVSVKKIKEDNRIVGFTKKEEGINQALQLQKSGKNWYGIIRCQQRHEDMVKTLVESNRWKCVEYDSVSADRKTGKRVWENMNQEPTENTVILIRGKCRMGKNLEKKHLLFVFETSKNSKTDTVLQSLLGRTCGYSEGSDRVTVYLSEKIVKSGEIERYIDMWDKEGVEIMPTSANNLADKKVKRHVPIIPVKINLPIGLSRDDKAIENYIKNIFANEKDKIVTDNSDAAFKDSNIVAFKDSNIVFEELSEKILNSGKFKRYNIKPGKKVRNETKGRELIDAHERKIARDFGSGCGVDSNATEINIWVFGKDLPAEFDKNTIYITAHVTREDIKEFNIPTTTGREVFSHRLEDGANVTGNGGMTIRLSSHTANNITAMKTELCKNMIEVSLRTQGCDRKVASCWDDNENEFKGILVTQDIYKQLQKGGSIYEHVKHEYGLQLHTCKSSGPQPKDVIARGFIKLASISW